MRFNKVTSYMVDSVECIRKVQKGQEGNVATV